MPGPQPPDDIAATVAFLLSEGALTLTGQVLPVNRRPWGTLTAIDLNRGAFRWQVPLGTYPALERRGLPPTGTFNIGGPICASVCTVLRTAQ